MPAILAGLVILELTRSFAKDELMTTGKQQLALRAETHRNHYLFSDYYLDHRLAEQPVCPAKEPAALLAQLRDRWAAFVPQPQNEAQTEQDWIRPVLDALGHHYNVQTPLQTHQVPVWRNLNKLSIASHSCNDGQSEDDQSLSTSQVFLCNIHCITEQYMLQYIHLNLQNSFLFSKKRRGRIDNEHRDIKSF